MEKPDAEKDGQSLWAVALGVGAELSVSVLVGFWVGYELDKRWRTEPWLTLAGSFAGMLAGFYSLFSNFKFKDKSRPRG